MPETGNQGEAPRPIEKPVTIDALRKAAEAGYVSEVYRTIRLAGKPVSASEGGELLNIAVRVEADRLEKEADLLQSLAGLSDDPGWQDVFAPRANEMRTHAESNRAEANAKQSAIDGLRGTGVPFHLTPRTDK